MRSLNPSSRPAARRSCSRSAFGARTLDSSMTGDRHCLRHHTGTRPSRSCAPSIRSGSPAASARPSHMGFGSANRSRGFHPTGVLGPVAILEHAADREVDSLSVGGRPALQLFVSACERTSADLGRVVASPGSQKSPPNRPPRAITSAINRMFCATHPLPCPGAPQGPLFVTGFLQWPPFLVRAPHWVRPERL